MNVVGPGLADQLLKPFAHLEDHTNDPPALRIDVFPEAEGSKCPSLPAGATSKATWNLGTGLLVLHDEGRFLEYSAAGSVTWFDRGTCRIIAWMRSPALSAEERSKPFQYQLFPWYAEQGLTVLHAGLVAMDGKGVLIGGPSGAGKSTTSLACLLAGFDYLGDDHVGLRRGPEGQFRGLSLYGGARVSHGHLERFECLSAVAIAAGGRHEKDIVFPGDAFPGRLAGATDVVAVVLPRQGVSARSGPSKASPAEALLRLAPSSAKMPLVDGKAALQTLADLVQTVPAFWLDLGNGISEIPGHVRRVLYVE